LFAVWDGRFFAALVASRGVLDVGPDHEHGLVQVNFTSHQHVAHCRQVERVCGHVRGVKQHVPTPQLAQRLGVLLCRQLLEVRVRHRVLAPAAIHQVLVASERLQLQRLHDAGPVDQRSWAGESRCERCRAVAVEVDVAPPFDSAGRECAPNGAATGSARQLVHQGGVKG
jgi:hypothetical protein